MRSGFHLLGIAAAILAANWPMPATAASDGCEPPVATIVSVQGSVEVRRAGEIKWQAAPLNDRVCAGDTIRVQEQSRAAIALVNETILRLDQNTTVTFPEPEKTPEGTKLSLRDLLRGAIHFFSRVPRTLEVNTPFVNAAVEGTEFLITVGKDRATLTVFEGELAASNKVGRLVLTSGQSAVAMAGEAPKPRVVVRPRDAVHWALYYPAIADYRPADFPGGAETAWQGMVRRSIEFYRQGDLTRAFSSIAEAPENIRDSRFFTYRAALLLTVGRVDEASTDIDKALSIASDNSHAFALQSIIAVVQNERDKALDLAIKAVALDTESAAARVALSYAQQANFDLTAALASLQEAVELNSENALAWARLSELWLSVGELRKALEAATKAVSLNPNLARTQTVLGFANLTQIKIRDAKAAFEMAIALDAADPLSRLGLGLARIRQSDLEAGRREIEIAVSLDPNNSLIRSYLGKAYFEEKRTLLAKDQFDLAKELDPTDPTAWFYDAILKQTENQPIEALADLQTSIEKNDNRAVYRSRLLLDKDRAGRGASLARIYDDLGFEQLGVVEGTKSLGIDPANHSAHRFLSDSYAAQPRHEIARASELLQSQLLQPININPVQPQLPEIDLNILKGAGPAEAAFNEFTRLFVRDGPQLVVSGVAGNNDTLAGELVLSGISGRVSYSVGGFHHESDGFRTNNDLEHDIYNLFVQAALTDQFDIQFEYRRRETEQGDLRLNFDPDDFSILDRRRIEQDVPRLGLHFAPSPRSDFVVSLIQSDREEKLNQVDPTGATVDVDLETEGDDIQAQYLFRGNRFNITAGLGASDTDVDQRQVIDISPTFPGGICPPFPPFFGVCAFTTITDTKNKQRNAYIYVNVLWPTDVIWTVGVSHDSLEEDPLDVSESNPKAGLQWNFTKNARLRLAYMETVKRTLIAEQTLEPTQVAGFAQFFDDLDGTKAKRYGIGLDATLRQPRRQSPLSAGLYAGFEISKRDLEVPLVEGTTGAITPEDQREDLDRVYLYWTPRPAWAVRTEYQFERFKRKDTLGLDLPTQVETTTVPVFVSYFRGAGRAAGLFAQVGATFVHQDVDLAPTSTFVEDSEDFVVVDAAIGYRLRRRRGILSMEVRNLFDEDFLFQDANIQRAEPSNPRFIPDRTIIGRVTLSF